jgi:carbon-monoxide dehydrogenase medium subunit
MALGATMVATGPAGAREIAAEEFLLGLFATALQPAEVLTHIRVPLSAAGTGGAYLKHRHPASSYAVVGIAALVTLQGSRYDGVRLVVGGATAGPMRCAAAEAALQGQEPGDAAIGAASRLVSEAITDPMGDLYASGEYRRHLATVMAGRALALATERARG